MGILGAGDPHLVRAGWLWGFPWASQPQRVEKTTATATRGPFNLLLTCPALNLLRWFLFNTSCGSRYRLLKTGPIPPNSLHGSHRNNPLANNFLVATGPGCAGGTEVEMKGPVFHYRSPKRAAPWGDYDFFLKMKMYHLSLNAYCLSGASELASNDSVPLGRGVCVRKVDGIIGISSHCSWNSAVSQ